MPMREDPKVVAQRDHQLRLRQLQSTERRAGMPSPRARALAAGRLVARRGEDEREVRTVEVWHRMPAMDLSHNTTSSCWCQPTRSAEGDGTRWFTHSALARDEEPDDSGIAATKAMLDARER